MRNNLGSVRLLARLGALLGVVVGLVAATPSARADELAGQYSVIIEPVSTNCQASLSYSSPLSVKINVKGGDIQIDIERTPLMVGKVASGGTATKISVKSRPGHTMIDGMDGVFSIAGRITEGQLKLVMVGEYTHNGAPLCTQSWNLRGNKVDAAAKPKR